MKFTKTQLKNIIKEELEKLSEYVGDMGGMTSGLGSMGRATPQNPEDELDSQVQSRAMTFLMDLGLDDKVSQVFVNNIAIPDLQTVMDAVPKIDTAAEEDLA